jgi:hypothetical protein
MDALTQHMVISLQEFHQMESSFEPTQGAEVYGKYSNCNVALVWMQLTYITITTLL